MDRHSGVLLLLVVGALSLVGLQLAPEGTAAQTQGAIPLGAGYPTFTVTHVSQDGHWVRAFMRTDSADRRCLVTLGESNFAKAGTSVFCGPRTFAGRQGLLVTVVFPEQVPPDFFLTATVYQQDARMYGAPVFYTESN